MKLSICMMVKNEEKNLPRCLNNLKPLIDAGLAELIIIDTGSEDESINIAKQYTDKVYFHKWNKNFSEMRNKTISYAKGEWIFIIDADERLDDIDKMIILLKSTKLDDVNTVILNVKNLYDLDNEDRYNLIVSPRLFKNKKGFRYEGAVHNQPIFKGPNLSVDISLTHYGYICTDKELMDKKYKRTVELLKNELEKEPENLYYLYQLGVSYDMHKDHKDSLEVFRKAYDILKKNKLLKNQMYDYILASYARIAYTNGEIREAKKIAKLVVEQRKEYLDMYYILAISEKMLGNKQKAFENYNTYLELVEKYNKLEISKDLSIIMYHMDVNSISNGYFEITKYFIDEKDYLQAYNNYKKITVTEQKIYTGIEVFIGLKKYIELTKLYASITEKERKLFLTILETKLNKIENEDKAEVNKIFSTINDKYGLLCKYRLSDDLKEKNELSLKLLEKINFDKEEVFYSEILTCYKNDFHRIVDSLAKVEAYNVKKINEYLIYKDDEFIKKFEEYVLDIEKSDLNFNEQKVVVEILSILLLMNLKDNKEINEKYSEIFKVYIEIGINFVSNLYQIDKAELIYKNVGNMQERFFILMYLVKDSLLKNEDKISINYMIEAVNLFEVMAKYIDIYKNELFCNKEEKINNEQKREFEEYKIKIKENINELINKCNIQEAKSLVEEYKKIVTDDIDIYSIEAVIAIMENEMSKAESILNCGLEKDPYNKELLLNMSYLMDITNNSSAVEYFCKSKLFNSANDIKPQDIITNIKPIDNNNLNVVMGTMEIANQMNIITKGLNKIGVNAKTINYYPSYLGFKSDQILDISSYKDKNEANIDTKKLASKLIAENDIFHFHFGTSLTLDYSDLPLIKELGKKSVMQYWGSEVRLYSKAIELNPYARVKNINEDIIKRKLELISKYIPDCIVDYELAEYVKDYHANIHYSKVAMDLEKFKFVKETQNKKLLIVHAPTSPEIKGTSYILKAIEELKQKYDFDFKLVQGMSNAEAKKIYEKADLIIDQILCGGYGVFAVESMAMGKPVIAWISDFMREKYPKELPIISANPDTIKEKIEFIINNREMLKEIGVKSRCYVEEHHDVNVISSNILDIYKKL